MTEISTTHDAATDAHFHRRTNLMVLSGLRRLPACHLVIPVPLPAMHQ